MALGAVALARQPKDLSRSFGNQVPSLQSSLVVVAILVLTLGQPHPFPRSLPIPNHTEQVRNTVEPSFFLVVRADDVPRRVFRVGCFEHLVARPRILVPAAKRF